MSSAFHINEGSVTKYAYITGGTLDAIDTTSTPLSWTEETVISTALIDNTEMGNKIVVGSNFSGELTQVVKYKVFKTIGQSTALHYIGELDINSPNIFEDFVIGNGRQSTYYIFPIMTDKDSGAEVIKNPIISKSITVDFNDVSIIGLKRTDEDSYSIDYNNIWRFGLNLNYKGLTLNNDKVFTDGLSKFPKANIGKRNYFIAQPVSGLIGRIDCETSNYVDSAELVEEWRAFAMNGNLKLFRDTRGIMFPCDIRDVSYEYDTSTGLIYVSFTPVQLAELTDISIRCTQLTFDSSQYNILADNSRTLLASNEADGTSQTFVVPMETRSVYG